MNSEESAIMSVSQATQILGLMSQLDALPMADRLGSDESLSAQSPAAQAIIRQLVAEENRDALREWYAQSRRIQMNPSAESFRRLLEKITGETLR
jgi:hypothetical protein